MPYFVLLKGEKRGSKVAINLWAVAAMQAASLVAPDDATLITLISGEKIKVRSKLENLLKACAMQGWTSKNLAEKLLAPTQYELDHADELAPK